MDITFSCNTCGQSIVIDEAGEGQRVDCPKCGGQLEVPRKSRTSLSSPALVRSPASRTALMLRSCPDCQQQISRRALTCPTCGAPIVAARMERHRKIVAVVLIIIGVAIIGFKGFRLKSIGDEALAKVGLGSRGVLGSWNVGMGFQDLSNDILLPTKDLMDALDENFERYKWNLDNPDRTKKQEISIDHLKIEYKQKIEAQLEHLYELGKETATEAAVLGAVFLVAASLVWPKRRTVEAGTGAAGALEVGERKKPDAA